MKIWDTQTCQFRNLKLALSLHAVLNFNLWLTNHVYTYLPPLKFMHNRQYEKGTFCFRCTIQPNTLKRLVQTRVLFFFCVAY